MVRLLPAQAASLDEWRRQQADKPGRPEAIRRLLESGLVGAIAPRPRSKESKIKAAEMAGQQIDRIGDRAATEEERAQRKRRLVKGPREFRDVRGDQPKTKS